MDERTRKIAIAQAKAIRASVEAVIAQIDAMIASIEQHQS